MQDWRENKIWEKEGEVKSMQDFIMSDGIPE
jgi:hypothetical protein